MAQDQAGCCGASRNGASTALSSHEIIPARSVSDFVTVPIAGGVAMLGTQIARIPDDGENPLRKKSVRPFRMGATTVTNEQFRAFVDATGYITEAERFGWSFVFWADVPKAYGPTETVPGIEWWHRVEGANWRTINGPGTDAAFHSDHPVVQVSWADALTYARWAGGRLPTEAEWEHAARGGQGDVPFPWGDVEPNDTTHMPCNIWQGDFPTTNTAMDGYARTAPAQWYDPNEYGLYQMAGNVWEWTSDKYTVKSLKKQVRQRLLQMHGYRLSKGGSFMCHKSYCYRYRIAARSGTSPDSAAPH